MSESKVKGLWIATRCRSIDEFVARFHPFCDDGSIFMATLSGRAVGDELPFAILLRDKTPALRGHCTVLDSWTDANNPFGRPGVRLGLCGLSAGSEVVFARLRAARREASQPHASAPQQQRARPEVIVRPRAPTVEAVVFDARTPQVTVRVSAIGRETAPMRGIASVAAIAIDGAAVAVQTRSETLRVRPNPRAMTAPLRGDDAPFTSEEPTERMIAPPAMAEGTAPVVLPPATHFAVRAVTASGMISPRTPGSNLVLPANPLMNLTDASLGGFVDSTLDGLLGTTPEPEPPRELARGSSDRLTPLPAAPPIDAPRPRLAPLVSLDAELTQIVSALPSPHRRRVSWLAAIAAFALATGIGFAASYFVTTLI